MKRILVVVGWLVAACAPAVGVEMHAADVVRRWDGAAPVASLEDAGAGFSRLVTADDRDRLLPDAVGRPDLPNRIVLFAVPDRMEPAELTIDTEWETFAANVRVVPVAEPVRIGDTPSSPEPDPLVYAGTESYPREPVVRGVVGTMSGVRVLPVTVTPFRWNPVSGLLESVTRIAVSVRFVAGTSRSSPQATGSAEAVRAAVVNPEDVSEGETVSPKRLTKARMAFSASARTDPVDYLLISPPEFVEDWTWYVGERRKTHTNLIFRVVNTGDIYRDYPFAPTNACRNAAESIHAYLRARWKTMGFTYVVLGGAWLDAQNWNNQTTYFATGETMSLSNCVPGIYGFPREEWRQIPSDLFYGCLDIAEGQKYPWDSNGDGKYIDKDDCINNNTYPDVIVSRITLNPYTGIAGKVYNPHALVTNYVAKLARGEAKDFAGHYCYGMSAASTGSSKLRKTGDRMYYRELEFYDGMPNMFDPRHHDTLEDDEYSTRVRYYDQYSNWRPLRRVKGMMNYTWTGGQPSLAAAMDDYYASDRDFGFVQAHGWAQGAAQFSAGRFATAKGLTLFNGGSGPCETGYPDYYVVSAGKAYLQYNVGDAAVTNPDGGALASVNNSRWSWAGGGGGFAAMSYYMLNEMLCGFNEERKNVGHAWLRGVRNYWPAGRWGNTAGWVLTEQFLYGDPLVQLPTVPHVWWTGGETGVWDRVTGNWTNNLDAATTFDVASNVYFNVGKGLSLDVADEIAALRLSLPVWEDDAVITLAGTGSLRVMQAIDVAGTNTTLRFDVAGGVGHNGIRFLTGAGDLVFAGTNKFYIGGIRQARRVSLLGGGVTLDFDEFPKESFALVLDGGSGTNRPAVANELRSKNVGGLARFGSLAITNSHVKLSTVDAFGIEAPITHTLVNSELEIAANVYYQRSGFPEGLNATFLVAGDSAVTSSAGGVWTVKHTTTFALGDDAHLTLSAATVPAGGRIILTNALAGVDGDAPMRVVEIVRSNALAGDVTVGKGVRLVLRELPLESVTSLTIADGASVELPDDASGYWQIVPVSSKLTCGGGVRFTTAAQPSDALDGSPSATGSFFREGALYRWTGSEGDWDLCFADTHPRMLFDDLAANDVTVRVAGAVSPRFVFFSNLRTKFVFTPAAEGASVGFSSIFFYGPTAFDVPVFATEYAGLATATSRFSRIVAPYVHVAAGAGLALAGSHWTDFRLDAGAVLVAVAGETLDWNAETTFTFPDEGAVLIDVGNLALSATPTPLVTGFGHRWTQADLTRFQLVQSDAELRLVDGALCVVQGDRVKGPYALEFEGETNWNCTAWTATNGAAFPREWGSCALDWAANVDVSVSEAGSSVLVVDGDVHADRLTFNVPTNNVALEVRAGAGAAVSATTLDLSGIAGRFTLEVGTGNATILTPTNETAECTLLGTGSGAVMLSGSTLNMACPGDFTLMSGAQGTLRIRVTQGYERFRAAKVASGFELGGLQLEVTDRDGRTVDGFTFAVSNGALWCTPPALSAEVPPGTNEFTHLVWTDALGGIVSNVDWQAAKGFELVGTPTSGVVIAKRGFETYWNRLVVTGEVTAYGNETLAPSVMPTGSGTLTLAGAFTVRANLKTHPQLLNAAHLGIGDGSVMEITHGNANFDASGQNWRGIVGTGRLVFADGKTSWIAVPYEIFANTLTVETASDIVLTQQIRAANPFGVQNLSGAGTFRSDWGNGSNLRPVRTVQTAVSAFSGSLSEISSSRDSKLVVASDAPTPTLEKALILDGKAGVAHTLDIETNGCVVLTGTWVGPINVQGLLVITNACATNGLKVTLSGQGAVQVIAANEVPPVATPPSDYVEPTYPADPTPPEEPPATDTRVRILSASVGASGGTWSRLDWCDPDGAVVPNVDWTVITNVTLTATAGLARVVFDATDFTGVARLTGGVCVEARKATPFVLAAESEGEVDFRLSPVPAATTDLLAVTATDPQIRPSAVAVTIHDRYGNEIAVAGEVAFNAASRRYYLNVQNVDRPNYSNTFDTQYDDTLTTSLGYSGSGGMTFKDRPGQFEPSRSGRALKGDGLAETIHSHNGVATVNMSGVNAWSINFVVKLPTNDKGIVFGWGNKDSGNGIALARASANVAGVYAWKNGGTPTLVASARVPFASTQFHSYAITHDGQTLRLYADGALAEEASLEGKYPTTGHYQYFKMYGQNGGLQNGTSAVVDDFRLYLYCLTPTSVRVIANAFRPWPETVTATVWKPGTRWEDLVWNTEIVDWNEIATACLVRGAEDASVWCDSATFTNALVLSGGVTVEATNELPFVLAPDPKGTVAFTLNDVTVSRRLARVAPDFASDDAAFAVTVHGADGETPPQPSMVTRFADGAYWLRIQDVAKPRYAFSFDGAFTTSLPGVTVPALKDADNASWERSRSGHALTGRNPYFANGLGTPSAWTMHLVARLSAAANGITFAYGSTGQGLALYSPQADVVAVGAWSGSARRELLRMAVPNAQIQFHAYALASTGSRIALWVDGVQVGEAACSGYPGNGNAQFFSVYGGTPAGYAVGTDGAVDDWRFFEEVLAPAGIVMLANEFRPWPEYRYAELTEADTTWENLSWQGAEGNDKQILLRNKGGSLLLTNACELTTALTAGSLSLRVTGDGLLRSDAGLTFSSGLQIDASGLDGTNLAKLAVAGAPYVRWLVRGAYTGRPTVTALPTMPKHYTVRAEDFSGYGVRLVVTAQKGIRLGSVSVSIGDDDFAALSGELGIYPERANAWLSYRTWSTAFQKFGQLDVAAIPMVDGQIDVASPYAAPAPLYFRHTSFDGNGDPYDGKECGYVVSNLTAFATHYRIIAYLASNQASCWGPVTIGGRNYTGLLKGSDAQWATLSDSTLSAWGMRSSTPREGVNAVISDVLTNDVVSIIGHRQWVGANARGQIAAFQVVKVGEIPEVRSVDYVATVTADATWANGSGEGLLSADPWVNDPGSTITLTTGVSSAALTFDTVVTASVIRVVESAVGNLVLMSSASLEHEIESLDLEQAAGRVIVRDTLGARYLFAGADTVLESRGNLMLNVEEGRCLSLAQGIGWTADDTVGSGGHVRFLGNRGALAAPPIQAAGAIVSYEKATVTRAADNEFSVLRTLPGDEVVYNANGKILLNPLHVRGGSLTLRNSSSGRVLYYGSVRDVQARHSSIEVSGGRLVVETTGTGTSNQDCGLLVGTTSTTVHQPNIAISDGEMDLGDGRLTMWERSDLTVSGGKLTAQGLWKGGGGTTTVRLSGDGVISLGAGGIGKSGAGSMAVTLAGGTLQARATLTNALTTSIAGTVRLEALPGHTMTFATAPTGSGTLLCGSDAARGTIAFVGGLSSTLTLDGSFTACLTAVQAASDAEVALFKTGPSFDRTKFTLLGPNGSALPSGEVRYVDGMAIWMPASAAVDVGVNGVAVRVPRTWLAAQGIDATELADNHALTGLNGLPVAASYWLGLEPTNAQDGVTATISVDATGGLTLDLPKIDADRQPNAAAIRYVIQSKAALDDEWQDLSTNAQTTVTIQPEGQSARFFRYLILFR